MADAKITLFGMEHYLDITGADSLFKNLTLPAGIVKNDLIDCIMLRGGEFPVLFADPEFMRYYIKTWGVKWYRTFEKWYNALQIDYDPLMNYDRREEWEDLNTGTRNSQTQRTEIDSDEMIRNGTDQSDQNNIRSVNSGSTEEHGDERTINGSTSDYSAGTNDQTNTDSLSAYNSSAWENDRKTVVDSDTTASTTGTSTSTENGAGGKEIFNSETETGNDNRTGSYEDKELRSGTGQHSENSADQTSNANKRSGRAYGNIGVTTSQQMLEQELEIATWNLYEHISDIFLQEFTIPIYL